MNKQKTAGQDDNEMQTPDHCDTAEHVETEGAPVTAAPEHAETQSPEQLQEQIEQLNQQMADAADQLLRAQAEVENIRRRSAREQLNTRKFAIEGFASELLAVKDSLDLAQQVEIASENETAVEKMHEGIALTIKQLDKVLEKFSILAISPEKGDKLDPELHQAMTVQPSDEVGNNCILALIQKGYQLHDRLLRPAMVVIARTPEQKNAGNDEEKA